jgi:signal transduction histidine kinase
MTSTGTSSSASTGTSSTLAVRESRIRRFLLSPWRGFVLTLIAALNIGLSATLTNAISFLLLGVGVVLLPVGMAVTRAVANQARRLAGEWSGVEIARPYRPRPAFQPGVMGLVEQCRWILTDPASWRDLLWTLFDPGVGGALAMIALALPFYGIYGIVITSLWPTLTHAGFNDWYMFVHVHTGNERMRWVPAALGAALIPLSAWASPALIRVHARWTRVLLAPTRRAELARRIERLTETRADAVDAQAAELRRIERDLHDGAQARLVAMGMNLSAAEALLDEHPEAARTLLAEAREASIKALTELRGLVRGIHPPVLADRGLGDAVRAVALDSPLATQVSVELPGRLEPAVESAAYFAVCELLANAAKHARAQRFWVDIRHEAGLLRIGCTDDGVGGADMERGTGLRGIERRIGTFDGVMALTSPHGGPTAVTLEIPCALSSPKTSTS